MQFLNLILWAAATVTLVQALPQPVTTTVTLLKPTTITVTNCTPTPTGHCIGTCSAEVTLCASPYRLKIQGTPNAPCYICCL